MLVIAIVLSSSWILVTLIMEAIRSSQTSVLTRATRRNIQEDDILHSHRRENLKCYNLDVTQKWLMNWRTKGNESQVSPYHIHQE
jgi:hypothetical protein